MKPEKTRPIISVDAVPANIEKIQPDLGSRFRPRDYLKYAEAFCAAQLQIQRPEEIQPILKKAFETLGPVLIGVHFDYGDNAKLFEHVHHGSIL